MAATNNSPVFLARHGRTALNAENRLRGRLDPDLDDVGREEAAALADVLAAVRPVRVVSSPLHRAMQTARAIAHRAGLDVVVAQGLNDRDYGEWAGQPKEQVVARWGSIDAAPGVEPAAAVFYRACAVL
jgi:broad specificity phosphatase PhoE